MEFIIDHFGYIAGTLTVGVMTGWATYPLFTKHVKPLFNRHSQR